MRLLHKRNSRIFNDKWYDVIFEKNVALERKDGALPSLLPKAMLDCESESCPRWSGFQHSRVGEFGYTLEHGIRRRRGYSHEDGVKRKAEVVRETRETQITLKLNIDGSGKSNISTSVGFLDHLLELFAKHGFFDLEVNATGDLHVDAHHTVEDVGICLGDAFREAVGEKIGMRRFGSFTVPMYEALAQIDLDLCGRSYLHYQTPLSYGKVGTFDVELAEEFFHGFVNHSGTTLHINVPYGTNRHHIIEAIFKGVAKALDISTSIDDRVSGVLSTKGTL